MKKKQELTRCGHCAREFAIGDEIEVHSYIDDSGPTFLFPGTFHGRLPGGQVLVRYLNADRFILVHENQIRLRGHR